jgi:DNA-binding FadR family transcriptional regulator
MTNDQSDHVSAERLYEQIERVMAREIVDGVYDEAGVLPSERKLMDRFGVGRPAVREALFSLERRGLVERRQGRRVRPLKPTFKNVLSELDLIVRSALRDEMNVAHLMELRRFIESSLAAKAAESANPEGLARLDAALAAGRAAISDQEAFWRADVEFHEALAAISNNPILPQIVRAILRWLIVERRITFANEERNRDVCRRHEAVAKAIHDGDAARAAQAMATHLAETEEIIRRR